MVVCAGLCCYVYCCRCYVAVCVVFEVFAVCVLLCLLLSFSWGFVWFGVPAVAVLVLLLGCCFRRVGDVLSMFGCACLCYFVVALFGVVYLGVFMLLGVVIVIGMLFPFVVGCCPVRCCVAVFGVI